MSELYAEIACFSALDKTLHYVIPAELRQEIRVGVRVVVPLRRRETTGMVIEVSDRLPESVAGLELRPIREVIDANPIVPADLIRLCKWIAAYYFYPLGEVLQTALPVGIHATTDLSFAITDAGRALAGLDGAPQLLKVLAREEAADLETLSGSEPATPSLRRELRNLEAKGLVRRQYQWRPPPLRPKLVRHVRLLAVPEPGRRGRSPNLETLVRLLEEADGGVAIRSLRGQVKNLDYWLKRLQAEGLVAIDDREELRDSRLAQSLPETGPPELTPEQQAVLEAVGPRLSAPTFQPFMLHGVTGSGKTEVYLRLVDMALKEGRGALVMVPEIALSTQLEALFRQRFGDRLAVWHSALPPGTRYDQWRQVLSGARKVVLGVRSAVFMPVSRLGIIVVDEEHDGSYKQEDHLRYHARDVALMRAKQAGIPIVLGSATPSLQTVHHWRGGRYLAEELPRRIYDRPLPGLEVVDMRREGVRGRVLSVPLAKALEQTLGSGKQALVFLNRRGFATFVLCHRCGQTLQCPSCSVSLTYHQGEDQLRCHYCGKESKLPGTCPMCGHDGLVRHGFGTERVQEELARLLPKARVVRVDRDTVSRSADMVGFLNAVRSRQADILLGTQMLAKGHDFPDITLVGVINADVSLQIPDYRAGETTVQLLMQVAGRAGRGDDPGRVMVQTYNPAHYTISSVVKSSYLEFCDQELASRERLQYPPFVKMLRVVLSGKDPVKVQEAAREFGALCRKTALRVAEREQHVVVMGPVTAPLAKLKGSYRWHLFVKTWTNEALQEFGEAVLEASKGLSVLRQVKLVVDRDPVSTL